MQSELEQPLISTNDPAFITMVETRLVEGELLVALLRYSHQGGARSYFLLKNVEDFHNVLSKAKGRDGLSIFFSSSFPVQGLTSLELKDKTIKFLEKTIQDDDEAIFVIRLDDNDVSLGTDDMKVFSKPNQIDKWFANHLGVPVIVGTLAFWEDNSDGMITAYVPDADGQVRRGAY